MSRKILNVATFGLLGKKKAAPAPIAAETPAVMPMPDDSKILAAKKRAIIGQRARRGRESTILTGDKLGG